MAFTPKTRKYLVIFLILGWIISLSYFVWRSKKANLPQQEAARLYRNNHLLMGTFWEVTSPEKEAGAVVFTEAERIENLLSKYLQNSEISRLNQAGKLEVSP